MKCPYCQKELPVYFIRTIIKQRLAMPTKRQMEAYRLVELQGLTFEQAAKMMGISRQAVAKLLGKATSRCN